MVEREPAKEY